MTMSAGVSSRSVTVTILEKSSRQHNAGVRKASRVGHSQPSGGPAHPAHTCRASRLHHARQQQPPKPRHARRALQSWRGRREDSHANLDVFPGDGYELSPVLQVHGHGRRVVHLCGRRAHITVGIRYRRYPTVGYRA